MTRKVLICGEDPLLLRTREEVLRTAAFTVASLADVSLLASMLDANAPGLLILCHSLPGRVKVQAVALVRAHSPGTKIVWMTGVSDEALPAEVYEIDPLRGPRVLLEVASALL